MSERWNRVLATGLTIDELAERLGSSDRALFQWLNEDLPVEQSDILEVALTLFERDADATDRMLDHLALA